MPSAESRNMDLLAEHADLTESIIGCAMRVHEHFGPGLFESVYQRAVAIELQYAGFSIEVGRPVPLTYREVDLGCIFRPDLIVSGTVVTELKAVDTVSRVHYAQLLTYLKLTGCPVGLIINFNVVLLKEGIRRAVRPDLYKQQSSARDRASGCREGD